MTDDAIHDTALEWLRNNVGRDTGAELAPSLAMLIDTTTKARAGEAEKREKVCRGLLADLGDWRTGDPTLTPFRQSLLDEAEATIRNLARSVEGLMASRHEVRTELARAGWSTLSEVRGNRLCRA